MKRKFNLIMAMVLSMSMLLTQMLFVGNATATTEPTISVSSAEKYVGETADVTVTISNNPGVTSVLLTVGYDSTQLELIKVTDGGLLGSAFHSDNYQSPYTLSWANDTATSNITNNGVVVTLTFKVSEQISENKTLPITITYDKDNYEIIDKDMNPVSFSIVNGSVDVKLRPVSVNGVSLNKETLSLNTGASETLFAIATPNNATNKTVTWESSDDSVATVDTNGKVTAVKKGTATITVTTDDGSYTDTCEVNVSCSHINTTTVLASDSTCLAQGNNEYVKCDDCSEIISGSDEKLPFANHKGGTATCKDKAVCTVCNQPYGNYAAHDFSSEITDAKYLVTDATCVDKAVYYKSCSVCGFADTSTFTVGNTDSDNHVGGTYIDGQKEASCYEEGYTGDTKCNSCHEVIEYGVILPTSSHNPAIDWSTDEEAHWKDCETIGCGNLLDYAKHSVGEATCINKAVCSVCQAEYGSLNSDNHKNTELQNVKLASEDEEGYTGDTYCFDCQKIVVFGSVIPKLTHIHSMNKVEAEIETCTEEGNIAYWYCTKCEKYYTDENGLNQIEQDATVIAKKEHSYTVLQCDADSHWYKCSGCTAIDADEEHTGGTATCTAKAVCDICGTSYGELAAHTYVEKEEAEYLKSEANCVSKAVYYVSCEACGAAGTDTFEAGEIDSDNHTGEIYLENQEDATCTEDGYSGDVYCEDCGVKLEDGKVVPAGHKLEKVEAKEPTHEEDGNTEYYYCSGCEKAFADSEAEEEIDLADTVIAKGEHSYSEDYDSDEENHWKGCDCGSVIEKEAHTFGEWTVTKDATETEKGSKERVCSVCEYKSVEDIPAIGAEDESTSESESESESQNNTANDTPQTGDVSSTVLWSMLVLIAGFGAVGATVLKKKYIR